MSITKPETLGDVIEDLTDILRVLELERDVTHCAVLTVSAIDSLVELSTFYIGKNLSESRVLIAQAFTLAEQCTEKTGTAEQNTHRIRSLRQRAEVFD